METSRSEIRYLQVPENAREDEVAAVIAAVLACLQEEVDMSPSPPSNAWGMAGRRGAHGLPISRAAVRGGWGGR